MQWVERVVAVLTTLAVSGSGLGITELSHEVDIPKSSLHRVLQSLGDKGFVVQDKESRKYRLGPAVLQLSGSYLARMSVRAVSTAHLRALGEKIRESVFLTVLENDEAICVETFETIRSVRFFVQVGRRMPFHATAASKVLLAFQPPDVFERIFSKIWPLVPQTSRTIVDPEKLRQHLVEIRRLGYATCDGEMEVGVTAIAAPIWDANGRVLASVTALGPTERMEGAGRDNIVEEVRKTAGEISREMGHRPGLHR